MFTRPADCSALPDARLLSAHPTCPYCCCRWGGPNHSATTLTGEQLECQLVQYQSTPRPNVAPLVTAVPFPCCCSWLAPQYHSQHALPLAPHPPPKHEPGGSICTRCGRGCCAAPRCALLLGAVSPGYMAQANELCLHCQPHKLLRPKHYHYQQPTLSCPRILANNTAATAAAAAATAAVAFISYATLPHPFVGTPRGDTSSSDIFFPLPIPQ